jgi:DNA-directed RNA polymerase specialized sigma24 family protein
VSLRRAGELHYLAPGQKLTGIESRLHSAFRTEPGQLIAGEPEAFDRFVGHFRAKIFHYSWLMCRQREDAEEVAQETLLKVFENFDQQRRGCRASPQRVYRVYRQEHLAVRGLKRKRLVRPAPAGALLSRANQEWAIDFIASQEHFSLGTGHGFAHDDTNSFHQKEARASTVPALMPLDGLRHRQRGAACYGSLRLSPDRP